MLAAVARLVPGGAWRTEVVDLARRSSAGDGVAGRARELAGVAAFGLRLRSVRATAGRAATAWSQGARLGAVLVLGAGLARQLALVVAARDGGDVGGATLAALAAAAVAGALLCATRGRAHLAVGLAGLAVPLVVLGPAAAPRGPVVSSLVVGLVAVALTLRHGPPSPVPGGWTWLAVLGTPCALVLAGGGAAVAGATALGATLALPIVLLVAGGADPRFAVAAAVAWTWRFLAVDPSDVVAAIGAVRSSGIEPVFLRLGAMAWAIALAVLVARRSQRAAAL